MSRKFQIYPRKEFYTLQELENHLHFTYLPQISFETPLEQKEIRKKGLAQWKRKEICTEALELGEKFHEKIKSAYIPDVSIRYLDKSLGYGLFAEKEIEIGSYVGEYTGIVRKNDRRYTQPLNNYCYEYPVLDSIGRSFVTDATQGNLTRFINHSYVPNIRPVHLFYEGFYHLIFIAIKPIPKGTQLSYNYGQNYWHIREPPKEL